MYLAQDKFTDAASAKGLSLANPPVGLPADSKRRLDRALWRENQGCWLHGSQLRSGITTPGLSKLQAASRFSFCLYEKLPELDLYPPTLSLPNFLLSLPSPPPNAHAFQERKRVHQGLFIQVQRPALQSVGTLLTDTKRNYLTADGSPPRGAAVGSPAKRGRLPFPREDGRGHCHQPHGNV